MTEEKISLHRKDNVIYAQFNGVIELQDMMYYEKSLKKLIDHFPGFEYETIYGDRGWGGAISRDDITRSAMGKSGSFFSRLELTVRPLNEFHVVNITGKGTIQNKEMFNWNYFKDIPETDSEEFKKKIDAWILQYAEQFAAR